MDNFIEILKALSPSVIPSAVFIVMSVVIHSRIMRSEKQIDSTDTAVGHIRDKFVRHLSEFHHDEMKSRKSSWDSYMS